MSAAAHAIAQGRHPLDDELVAEHRIEDHERQAVLDGLALAATYFVETRRQLASDGCMQELARAELGGQLPKLKPRRRLMRVTECGIPLGWVTR